MSDAREDGPTRTGKAVIYFGLAIVAGWLVLGLATYGAVTLVRSWF